MWKVLCWGVNNAKGPREEKKCNCVLECNPGIHAGHHVYDTSSLREAYYGLKRNAAPGVDGETWKHYGEDLEGNLKNLSERLRRGAYRAKPVKRSYIPKSDGRQRPLGRHGTGR